MASYIERINKIAAELERTADGLDVLDNPSDEQEERSEIYRAAVEALLDAINELEGLN